eukprot:Hpha_TRINITY_DN16648_c3_g1::TRINITY_DN16648_c3_g1_i1::g.183406::m.183406
MEARANTLMSAPFLQPACAPDVLELFEDDDEDTFMLPAAAPYRQAVTKDNAEDSDDESKNPPEIIQAWCAVDSTLVVFHDDCEPSSPRCLPPAPRLRPQLAPEVPPEEAAAIQALPPAWSAPKPTWARA